MHENYFYHAILENSIKIFGKLFTNIRYKKGTELIPVPILYSSKDKIISKINQYDASDLQYDITISLPRIGFIMGDPTIDKSKQLNRLHKLYPIKSKDKKVHSYNSIPYIVPFYLSILTKTSHEMFQIVEQIIPFFSPELVITISDVPSLELLTDYVYKLDSITQDSNTWDGTFDERRLIVWTLSFSCELNMYFPVLESKQIKKMLISGFQDNELTQDLFSYTSEIIPFDASPKDVHVIKDVWQDSGHPSSTLVLSESYDIFITNFKNVITSDYKDPVQMDLIWAMIKDLLGVINSDKQISVIISQKQSDTLSAGITTSEEHKTPHCYMPLRDFSEIGINIKLIDVIVDEDQNALVDENDNALLAKDF